MILARVVGTVVATRKDPRLEGKKLLILKPVAPDGKDEAGYVISVDTVGAGGDEVLVEPFGAHSGVVLDHRQSRADCRGIPAALDGGVDERLRIPVGEQRAIAIGFSGPRHGHAQY